MELETISSFLKEKDVGHEEGNIVMILPTNLKKYVGHIREYEHRYVFEYILNKEVKVKESFYARDLGSKESAYHAVVLFQKKWCQNHNYVTNIYYNMKNEYILVELNENKKMKVDMEDIPYIEEHNWRIQNNFSYPTTFHSENKKREFISFSKMKYGTNKIHFKNNDKLDFRRENIILYDEL